MGKMIDELLNEMEARMADRARSKGRGGNIGGNTVYGPPGGNIRVPYAYRTKDAGDAAGAAEGPYLHGPGGLFGYPGINRDVISTRLHPHGLASILPARGSVVMNPLYQYLTSFGDPTGVLPVNPCDDPQEAGAVLGCLQTAQFGMLAYETRTLDIRMVNRQINRGEFLDLRMINPPLLNNEGDNGGITTPDVTGDPALTRDILMRFMEVGIAFQNNLVRQLYSGNPANNTAGGGYKEFPGLDILVGTNKFDAITGQTCPALDSYIQDFKHTTIAGPDQAQSAGSTGIIEELTYMTHNIKYIAMRTNLEPCTWTFVMRPQLFYELTAIWPCAYYTYRCTNLGNSDTMYIDAAQQIQLRDDMRQRNYLLIDGVEWPVVLDDGLTESNSANTAGLARGCFSSDILLLPLSVRGGYAAMYWEYIDYMQTAMAGLADARGGNFNFWTDGGRYLWHRKVDVNFCLQWLASMEARLILLTPHIAGRLQNVAYCPVVHTRDVFSNEPYFVGGGVGARTAPSFYSDWNHS